MKRSRNTAGLDQLGPTHYVNGIHTPLTNWAEVTAAMPKWKRQLKAYRAWDKRGRPSKITLPSMRGV